MRTSRSIFASSCLCLAVFTGACGSSEVGGGRAGVSDAGGADAARARSEAALRISITGGASCSNATFTVPGDPAVVQQLSCDPTVAGCVPDALVVVDGDPDTEVTCTVGPAGDGYSLNLSVVVAYVGRLSVSGSVAASGGVAAISEKDMNNEGLSDSACNLTVRTIKAGAILAHFTCSNFKNASSPSATGCTADGDFLFQNCGR